MSSVKYLLDEDTYLDIENEHVFLYALKFSDEAMICYVVNKGASVNEGKTSAYHIMKKNMVGMEISEFPFRHLLNNRKYI